MSSEPVAGRPNDLPAVIGGYRVVRELGRGRLGPVVLAVQRAGGRRVALRLLKPEWACLPGYVSRLARDAFAAAQVEHPNLVPFDEFGEARGRLFFAGEYVDGTSLADRVQGQGALTAPQAVAHVLQAARGLRVAHGQGLAHGDVRAENLVVDRDGLTRLSELGLTATPASVEADDARRAKSPIPVGAEAQAEADAAPFRADVRGLGLTLAYLLTGKADAHPTALLAAGLPMNLVELVRSAVEPRAGAGAGAGGLSDTGQLIAALERYLNARGASPATSPREDDANVLAECARSFRASPSAVLRRRVVPGAVAACAAVVVMGLLARRPVFAVSVLGLGLMTALADFVVAGLTGKSALFPRVRALVLESRGGDWLIGLAVAVVFASGLYALNLHAAWLAFAALAGVIAAGLHALDGKVEAERKGVVEEARALLARLRLQGVSEDALRLFVRNTAGDDWEGLFEALFGFEATRAARGPSERGLRGLVRGRVGPLRDAVAGWVDARQAARRRERVWALLQAIEERALVAQGVNLMTARRKSRRIAEALLTVGDEIRAASRSPAPSAGAEIADRPTVAQAVREAAEAPEHVLVDREAGLIGGDGTRLRDLIYGPRTRFLLGSLLLAGFFLWVHQNEVVSQAQIRDAAARAIGSPDPLNALRGTRIDVKLAGAKKPLVLPYVPRPILGLFHGLGPAVAGLVLVASAFLCGPRSGLVTIALAAFALVGPSLGVPENLALAFGLGVPAVLIAFGWGRDD